MAQFATVRASILARPIFRSRIRKAGIQTPAGLYGISPTGFISEKIIRRVCRMLKPGLGGLMTHPGIVDADLVRRKTRLLDSRAKEKELLVSAETKELFEEQEIILSHFGEVNQRQIVGDPSIFKTASDGCALSLHSEKRCFPLLSFQACPL